MSPYAAPAGHGSVSVLLVRLTEPDWHRTAAAPPYRAATREREVTLHLVTSTGLPGGGAAQPLGAEIPPLRQPHPAYSPWSRVLVLKLAQEGISSLKCRCTEQRWLDRKLERVRLDSAVGPADSDVRDTPFQRLGSLWCLRSASMLSGQSRRT